ncbi:DNA cytosine methyltransferase [Chitinophaga lutea]|nr:DNA cytosine methyltransferase [Chitinophaga lutea]
MQRKIHPKANRRQPGQQERAPLFIVVDLFCGAGGDATGFNNAGGLALVIACVNHDAVAIRSHRRNHPYAAHYSEDARTFDIRKLKTHVDKYRLIYPHAKLILWISADCTHYSDAAGGKPRDPDSRSMPEILHKVYDPLTKTYQPGDSYLQILQPDYVQMENVEEFMAWGPLDKKGRPIRRRNGEDWLRWRKEICALGYRDQWRKLCAADYGAHTHRTRLFGIFARPGLPIVFPQATHSEMPTNGGLFGDLLPWKPVREILNLSDTGPSIFSRKKPLCENTLRRMIVGVKKTVALNEDQFFSLYYSGGGTYASLSRPSPVVPTRDRISLVTLVRPQHTHTIYNPSWGGHFVGVGRPCPVVMARQDKAPLHLISMTASRPLLTYPTDSPATAELKELMRRYGITDIKWRLLSIPELLAIQGFPRDYQLTGGRTRQTKHIGNAVVPVVITRWTQALAAAVLQLAA